jgi:predicted nucleotidyltransferase
VGDRRVVEIYQGTRAELMKALAEWAKHAPTITFYLFGSRGRGDHHSQSDIDVFVDTKDATAGDRKWWFEEHALLTSAPECSLVPKDIRGLLRAADRHSETLQAEIRSAAREEVLHNVVCVSLPDTRKALSRG